METNQKRIAVLGCTGSIGRQTLEVIRSSPELFRVTCVCAQSDAENLALCANEFRPEFIGIRDTDKIPQLKAALGYSPELLCGDSAAAQLAELPCVDVVVNAVSGIAGLLPLVSAIDAGKVIAAANKESIVCAHSLLENYRTDGELSLVTPFRTGAHLIPVDSEQSAIFQCLSGEPREGIDSLVLTASGGAFRDLTVEQLENVTVADALRHPTWSMGKKITVDSATLFNKGLEIMEAAYLFGMTAKQIEVLIHPESIVHSMVRFTDSTLKAQISVPDMRAAIQYALTYPNRKSSPAARLDLCEKPLTFRKPDCEKYPSIPLAFEALKKGGALPIAYNSANEAAAGMFLRGETGFTEIFKRVEYSMRRVEAAVGTFGSCKHNTASDTIQVGDMAERYAREWKRT